MHRTNRVPSAALWSVLLGLSLGTAWTAALPASAHGQAQPADPQQKQPDAAKQADQRGNIIVLPINGTARLQMSSKAMLKDVQNPREAVVRVQAIQQDPTSVLLTGLEPGQTRITLTDVNGRQESYDVVVQFDVEYLRSLLQRAVPTATITPIPAANNTILLTGWVAHSEDVDVILRTAASIVGGGSIPGQV